MTRVFVGIGANLGERELTICRAAELIGASRLSSLRETEPWGSPTSRRSSTRPRSSKPRLDARALLEALLAVERELGRVRGGRRWGPRTIDLDLLLYGNETIDEPGLSVPHPFLHERRFVLEPLVELDPGSRCPGRGNVSALLAELQSAP